MKKSYITLQLDEERSIIAHISKPLADLGMFDFVRIIFKNGPEEICVVDRDNVTKILMLGFRDFINKVLTGRVKLHDSIKDNIGKIWNQYANEKEEV